MILNKEILSIWKKYDNEINAYKKLIDARVKEIYKKIFTLTKEISKKHNVEINYDMDINEDYCYDCGRANNPANNLHTLNFENINVIFGGYYTPPVTNIINSSGEVINLAFNFPQRWLFEDFEQELKDGLQKYADMMEQRKAKTAATKARSKEDKLKSIEAIKKKLSAGELELINFKKK